ncbi:PLD-like domain-containing protein [Hymenobacter gelipurpurascens]|uniref:PLD-like domain-containing protein n=1 Tax=Hymenobacter gelipurpurascens TaxID=89968 RepID=A0A212UHI5_9BACT|nr:phospholipase D-like domain-containing protein [Hymenobacter gelipurpurascens]SNC77623.1 PLD-like domain-containing protein [Hymenobacter gelipurpurascens]
MKILSPHHISSELLELIHSAKKYLVLVSPYVNITQWPQLTSALTAALHRGVRVEAFVRYDPDNAVSWEELETLGIRPRLITNLHAKFYFNETDGLISSLNLLSSSNASALEIGCKLETELELQELQNFVKRYLVPLEQADRPSEDDLYLSKEKFMVVLEHYLQQVTRTNSRVSYQHNQFKIRSGDNYFDLLLDKVKNLVAIMAFLSHDEKEEYEKLKSQFFNVPGIYYDYNAGSNGYRTTLVGELDMRLSTTYLDKLRVSEKKQLLDAIAQFVLDILAFKEAVYAPKRAAAAEQKRAWEAKEAANPTKKKGFAF